MGQQRVVGFEEVVEEAVVGGGGGGEGGDEIGDVCGAGAVDGEEEGGLGVGAEDLGRGERVELEGPGGGVGGCVEGV